MMALFEHLGSVRVTGRSGGTEEIDVHLPISPDDRARLAEAMRIAASPPDGD